MLITKQFILWKSMATVNCLVTNILQNIIFCDEQMKENQRVKSEGSKWWQDFHFWLNYPFNSHKHLTENKVQT